MSAITLPYQIISQSQETRALSRAGEGDHCLRPTRELHGCLQENHGGAYHRLVKLIRTRPPATLCTVFLYLSIEPSEMDYIALLHATINS